MNDQATIQATVNEAFWIAFNFIKPWIPKAAGILLGTYGILFFVKRFVKKIPDEVKAAVPCVLGIFAQILFQPLHFQLKNISMPWYFHYIMNAGIGFVLGAVMSSVYDIFVRRAKMILHKKIGIDKE